MINNPKNGWCDFDLGYFHGTPSYLTNVPIDLLSAFKDYLYSGTGICWFDEERHRIHIGNNTVFFIYYRRKRQTCFA